MPVIPVAEFAPDMPLLANATDIATNVVPATAESYGPIAALEPYSDAMDSQCRGAVAVEDASNDAIVFAGSTTKLYKLSGGATAWTDVSKAGDYTTGTTEYWRFAQFKGLVLATNFNEPVQSYDMASSTDFADLSGDAPNARFIAVIKNFVMLANLDDGDVVPWRARWSAFNEPTVWPTLGTVTAQEKQSDYNDFPGEQGAITGLVGHLGGADGAMFFSRGVWRIVYQGPPAVFGFYPVEGVRGTRASNSIVHYGSVVFYRAEDGFYAWDGSKSVPIGAEKVDKWFARTANADFPNQIIGGVDPVSHLVWWIFPSVTSADGTPDSAAIYNWSINRWSYASGVSAEWLLRSLSFGTSLEGLDTLFPSGLDSIPYSLDSTIFAGGALQFAAVDFSHKLALFGGQNLEAQIGTQTAQPFEGRRAIVQSIRPLVDGGTPTVSVGTRGTLAEAVAWGPDVAMNAMGECPQRVDGRYIQGRVTIPAGTVWTHARGVDVTATPGGWR